MRQCRFERDGEVYQGTFEDDQIVTSDGIVSVEDVRLLPPCQPSKIIGCGLNYDGTIDESPILEDGERNRPEKPFLFFKPPSTVVGHGDDIEHPDTSGIHQEAEVAVVIGEQCRNVSPDDALDVVRGYTAINDVTATDWPDREDQWVRSKGMDTFSPLGPCLQTDVSNLQLDVESYVNGERVQNGNMRDLLFTVPEVIAEVTSFMTMEPGDIIATGTPSGVTDVRPGDRVDISVERIGTLTNHIV